MTAEVRWRGGNGQTKNGPDCPRTSPRLSVLYEFYDVVCDGADSKREGQTDGRTNGWPAQIDVVTSRPYLLTECLDRNYPRAPEAPTACMFLPLQERQSLACLSASGSDILNRAQSALTLSSHFFSGLPELGWNLAYVRITRCRGV